MREHDYKYFAVDKSDSVPADASDVELVGHVNRKWTSTQNNARGRISGRLQLIIIGLAISTLFLLIRAIYRLIEVCAVFDLKLRCGV